MYEFISQYNETYHVKNNWTKNVFLVSSRKIKYAEEVYNIEKDKHHYRQRDGEREREREENKDE